MKTKLILILLLALPVFVYAQELKPCDRIVQNAKFMPIKFTFKTEMKDFGLSPDGKEVIFLLLRWQKSLHQSKDDYVMTEFFPRCCPEDHLSLKEGENIVSSWKEEAKRHTGLKINDIGKAGQPMHMDAKQTEFYLYNFRARRGRALPGEEGERLFKEWNKEPYNVLHPQKQSISPDGTMLLCVKGRKQKKVSALFGVLQGTAAAFAIDVHCLEGSRGRILNLPYDCFFQWKAQWSDKNDSALICDMTQQPNFRQQCYILQLNKE